MEKCGFCNQEGCGCGKDVGIFLIRLALAAVFILHGWAKLSNMEGTEMFFDKLGFPAILAWVVAVVETLGGLAMLLGVFTKYAGYLLAAIMLVAIIKVRFTKGFVGGWEFEASLLAMALAVVFSGAGKWTIKSLMGNKSDQAN